MKKAETKIENENHSEYVDYKDVATLKKHINPHARIMGRKRTGTGAKYQRSIALAIKRARYMGLLPYISR
jgi:small subunit ribosomal protein S18